MEDNHAEPLFDELIARSSLGTPEALALRQHCPPGLAEATLRRAQSLLSPSVNDTVTHVMATADRDSDLTE